MTFLNDNLLVLVERNVKHSAVQAVAHSRYLAVGTSLLEYEDFSDLQNFGVHAHSITVLLGTVN